MGGSWPLVALIFPGTLVTQPQHLNKCLICLQFPVLAGRKNRLAAAGECGKCAEGNGWWKAPLFADGTINNEFFRRTHLPNSWYGYIFVWVLFPRFIFAPANVVQCQRRRLFSPTIYFYFRTKRHVLLGCHRFVALPRNVWPQLFFIYLFFSACSWFGKLNATQKHICWRRLLLVATADDVCAQRARAATRESLGLSGDHGGIRKYILKTGEWLLFWKFRKYI